MRGVGGVHTVGGVIFSVPWVVVPSFLHNRLVGGIYDIRVGQKKNWGTRSSVCKMVGYAVDWGRVRGWALGGHEGGVEGYDTSGNWPMDTTRLIHIATVSGNAEE